VHQDVESAERVGALRDEVSHFADRSQVRAKDRAAASQRLDLRERLLGSAGIAVVVDDNIGAFLREAQGDALSDAFPAAGHKHFLAGQQTLRLDTCCCESRAVHVEPFPGAVPSVNYSRCRPPSTRIVSPVMKSVWQSRTTALAISISPPQCPTGVALATSS